MPSARGRGQGTQGTCLQHWGVCPNGFASPAGAAWGTDRMTEASHPSGEVADRPCSSIAAASADFLMGPSLPDGHAPACIATRQAGGQHAMGVGGWAGGACTLHASERHPPPPCWCQQHLWCTGARRFAGRSLPGRARSSRHMATSPGEDCSRPWGDCKSPDCCGRHCNSDPVHFLHV